MSNSTQRTWDANEATAHVAYRLNEVVSIYPITPASPMGEHADAWAAQDQKNLWGDVPDVIEMQSEAGAAGTVHGSLQCGALTTTFTASQGLLLMIPNMYKIAGELTPAVIHVAARSVATHALSIFGDHSDVYAARQTGFAMLAAGSVQEAHDFALISQLASLRTRLPFVHFFDGFRTSHEVSKTEVISDDDMRQLVPMDAVSAHRERALTPDRPVVRGTAQNPDVFFQAREAVNPFYDAGAEIVADVMKAFEAQIGRSYRPFDYFGHPEAERVIVLMGSGAEAVHETVDYLVAQGEKVGLIKVRLFRPFSMDHLLAVLPQSVTHISVLDRTKEPGAAGEPLYQDVLVSLVEAHTTGKRATLPRVVGGRYGLSSKEFTPAMIKAVFDNLGADPVKNHFTVGINDDVTHASLDYDASFDIEGDDVSRSVFFGLGADGTVGANKNSIKIIGGETDNYAQGYFVYDSKKSGAATISHLRFGPQPIRASYLVRSAGFVGCHQWNFLEKYDVLDYAAPGAVFLLNSPHSAETVWDYLPRDVQQVIIDKGLKFYVIDAYKVAREAGMGSRINTVMQVCFFALSGVLPRDEAIAQIKKAIEKTYGKKGDRIVQMNYVAVDASLAHLHEVQVPAGVTSTIERPATVPEVAPDFVKRVTATIIAGKGDTLPVSVFLPDGTWPTGTTKWEKRAVAQDIPVWDNSLCIQCNKCASVCPHAAIRAKVAEPAALEGKPESLTHVPFKGREFKGQEFIIQVSPDDCTGCNLCVNVCPAKDKSNPKHKALDMVPYLQASAEERDNWEFFEALPEVKRADVKMRPKDAQLLQPLFEFSGACAGCGETPYIKLLSQLVGDRLMIANATGCSSIYGGNLPTTPYTVDANGRGPAWSNSLFEDNAEFGLGFRLAVDKITDQARRLLGELKGDLNADLVDDILGAEMADEAHFDEQRARVATLKDALGKLDTTPARRLLEVADYLVRKSVWIVGGDGWAYDIGYGGVDHVLASGRNVNILVLDTEVYSNTGGQASKATPLGAVAKFAAAGRPIPKKDLGLLTMSYGNIYVAQVALGAKDAQTFKAFREAEAYPGPSLIIAYSHCIAHGYDLSAGLSQQDLAVDAGYWPLYRFDPRRAESGKPLLQLDSKAPRTPMSEYAYHEARYGMLLKADPARARMLMGAAQEHVERHYQHLAHLASQPSGLPEKK